MASPRKRSRDGVAAALLALFVLGFWLLRFGLAEGSTPAQSHDLHAYYYPLYAVSFGRLARGELPVWDPYQMTGLPWLATLQAGLFYPPHLLYALLPTPTALAASHALHLLLMALFTAAFVRRAGLSRAASALAALVFTLRGPAQSWLLFPSLLEAAAWLPLGALAVLQLALPAEGGGRRAVALLGLATAASVLAGYPQATVVCAYTWGALLVVLLLCSRPPGRAGLAALGGFAAALALGALVSAVQLLPTLELSAEATRPTEPLTRAQAIGFGPGGRALWRQIAGDRSISPGVVAVCLAPAVFLARRRRALANAALLLGLASAALAVGTGTAWTDVYTAIPVLGWFPNPRRLLLVTTFCAAVVAAVGCDALLRQRSRLLAGVVFTSALAMALAVARYGRPFAWLLPLGVAAVAGATGLGRVPKAALAAGLLLIAGVDGLVAAPTPGRLPYTDAAEASYRGYLPFLRALAERSGASRATWLLTEPSQVLKRAPDYGVRWVEGYEPLNLRRQADYFGFLRQGRLASEPRFFWAGAVLRELPPARLPEVASRRRLLDLAATRFFLAPGIAADFEPLRDFAASAGLLRRDSPDPKIALLENPHALPRAWVVYRVERAPPVEILLGRLSRGDFDPLEVAFVEGDLERAASAQPGHAARITRDEATRVEVEAELAAPGLVVLADAYAPGWRAELDGEPAPILATNHLFRGVRAPAGSHRIRFDYEPPGLRAGAVASAGGVALLLALAWPRRPRALR